MTTTPDWQSGLDWQCLECGAQYPSEYAKRECERLDADADRDARKR